MDEFQILKDSRIMDTFLYHPPEPVIDPDNPPAEPPEPVVPVAILGVPGFTLESLSYFGNSPSGAEAQRIVAGFAMTDLQDNTIIEGSSFSLEKSHNAYNFTVNRIVDMLDGWAEVYLDFVSRT